jgi:predicted  nucleic acid-binding Zn-ribbon protein
MAELQRKKAGLLRDAAERLASVSKVYYPLWIVPVENASLVLDGLGLLSHRFTVKEPVKTGVFIEELKKNSVGHQEFMKALEAQAREAKEFTSPVTWTFPAVVANRELLAFFLEYFKSAMPVTKNEAEGNAVIPLEIDEKSACEASKAFTDCLRTVQADAKGLDYALGVLNKETEFHKRAATHEIERLREKCELEVANLRPEVDKKVKKLALKYDKALANVLRNTEKKVGVLERKREKYVRKLQAAEQRKHAAQKRMSAARKKSKGKSTYGSYEVERYEREISNVKTAINDVFDDISNAKKEADAKTKKVEEEFREAAAAEEGKITDLKAACDARIGNKQKEIDKAASEAASIKTSFENLKDELKRSVAGLKAQLEIDWRIDKSDVVFAQFPFYLIKYTKEKEERYNLLSPMTISEDVSVMNGLRKILSLSSEPRLKALTRHASKELNEMLAANVIGKIQSDEVFRSRISAVCRANNLLDRMEFAETLNEGLDEVTKRGWLTSAEASAVCRRILEVET